VWYASSREPRGLSGSGGRGQRRSPAVWGIAVALGALLLPNPGAGQDVTERTANLSGGWVGTPGQIQFNFLHRFWVVRSPGEDKLVNSPTFLLAAPLWGRGLVGFQYASNSLVDGSTFNEWEPFARVMLLEASGWMPGVAATAAYNSGPGSGDGELSLVLPVGPVRVLGVARGFSDALDSGSSGFALGGGAVLRITDALTVSGDAVSLRSDGEREKAAWGAGVQLRIPTTPHSLSLHASNTRTSTLQGASVGGSRTVWGFEFTIPITPARYFPGFRSRGRTPDDGPDAAGDAVEGDEVEVSMTGDLRFHPEAQTVRVGQTVVWRNPTPVVHTVTADPETAPDPDRISLPDGAEPFDSGDMLQGDEFRHTFTVPGEYVYLCLPHDRAGMIGRIVVVP
jgi:plastocyanin